MIEKESEWKGESIKWWSISDWKKEVKQTRTSSLTDDKSSVYTCLSMTCHQVTRFLKVKNFYKREKKWGEKRKKVERERREERVSNLTVTSDLPDDSSLTKRERVSE